MSHNGLRVKFCETCVNCGLLNIDLPFTAFIVIYLFTEMGDFSKRCHKVTLVPHCESVGQTLIVGPNYRLTSPEPYLADIFIL